MHIDASYRPRFAAIATARVSQRRMKPAHDEENAMENRTTGTTKAPNGNFAQQAEDIGEQTMHQLESLREQAGQRGEPVVTLIKARRSTALLDVTARSPSSLACSRKLSS